MPNKVSKSSAEKSWRLVHDGRRVLSFFEAEGFTETINQLFTGTREECDAEIERLNLQPEGSDDVIDI